MKCKSSELHMTKMGQLYNHWCFDFGSEMALRGESPRQAQVRSMIDGLEL